MALENKKCVPCEGGTKPLLKETALKMMEKIEGWELIGDNELKILKHFEFKDFKQAMEFVNKVAEIAEEQGHHPDIVVSYRKVTLSLVTHAISGLSENDFIMAAKINALA